MRGGPHRQPSRAAKRGRRPVLDPVPNLSAVRDMNRPDLQDCQGLQVVPNVGDLAPINLMDWTQHGAPTASYAPGPKPRNSIEDLFVADRLIDSTRHVPFMLWGDARARTLAARARSTTARSWVRCAWARATR